MQHKDHLIDILNAEGGVIDTKPRNKVDKTHDIYHGVYILVCTSEKKLVLAGIPENNELPNLYVGRWGVTAATILRHDETLSEAAERCLGTELEIEFPKLTMLGTSMVDLPNRPANKVTAYYCQQPASIRLDAVSESELKYVTRAELESMLASPEDFSPIFLTIWNTYNSGLPL